jgi:hypothetical protein
VTATRHLPAHLRGDTCDPLLCGIRETYQYWRCSRCFAQERPDTSATPGQLALDQWRDVQARYYRLLDREAKAWSLPDPSGPEWLTPLTVALLHPRTRPLIQELLLLLLAEPIGELLAELSRRGGTR